MPASIAWVANLASYAPVTLPWPYPVRRVFWANGSAVTGNRSFGIYSADGTRIYDTGAVVGSGASLLQYTDVTDFWLVPGAYYFAYSNAGTTNQAWGLTTATAPMLRAAGVLQQATAQPLPATMTGATVTNAVYPLCGVTRTNTGFA
jgi:hypothetical protein